MRFFNFLEIDEDETREESKPKPRRLISTLSNPENALSTSLDSSLFDQDRLSLYDHKQPSTARLVEEEGSEVGAVSKKIFNISLVF